MITEQGPDTVRGADVAFYSYRRIARGPLPKDYGTEPPELVVEVGSPSERWPKILTKIGEYLTAGVLAVVVLDDDSRTALLCPADRPPRRLGPDDEFSIPEILPGFSVPVRRFVRMRIRTGECGRGKKPLPARDRGRIRSLL